MALKVVIIGNGITGITTARHIRKLSNAHITVISDETAYFFSRTALMYVYMGHLKFEHTQPYENWFWKKNKINLLQARVDKVDFLHKKILLNDASFLDYDKLIIATGSQPRTVDVPGQHLKGVQGLYHKQDVELMEKNTAGIRKAVIIGGGLIGIEMAEMLHSRNIAVDFLIREQHYWASVLPIPEATMISKHIAEYHINLHPQTELKEIIGDKNGAVKSIITSDNTEIECQFVGITIGVQPNVNFLKNSEIAIDKGILVNDFLETNIADVYAAGDCAQFTHPRYKHPAIEQLWYTGKMQGEALAQTICGHKTMYNRGVWFNSAKFLAIEYQTYGAMFNTPAKGDTTFYWEHPKGKIAMRANFNASNFTLTGFNFMGIRFRQAVAENWIIAQKNIWEVMENLDVGFFDPEFFTNHNQPILTKFLQQYPKPIA
jgi:NAD(P)H-nitrite reductase large subunit